MLAHPVLRESADNSLPEEALVGDRMSAFERSEKRLEDLENQVQEVQAKHSAINGRLDNLNESTLERLQVAEKAKLQAESVAQAAQQELDKWQGGELHHRLNLLWDRADNCKDCAKDKAAIEAELAAQNSPEALEAAQGADSSASEQTTQAGADTGPEASGGSLLDTNGEATVSSAASPSEQTARVKRFRVTREALLAFLDKGYQLLPDGVEEPRAGDETEDEVLADHWRRAGYRVKELENPSDDAHTEPIMYGPGWLNRIYGERG